MRHAKMDEGAAASARSRRCLLLDRKRMASVIMVSAVATGAFAELLPVEIYEKGGGDVDCSSRYSIAEVVRDAGVATADFKLCRRLVKVTNLSNETRVFQAVVRAASDFKPTNWVIPGVIYGDNSFGNQVSPSGLERDGELMNKDLTKLNRFDPRMLEICQRLGKRIANKRSRRKVQAHSHKIDMRRTMRANLKYGGVPMELVKAKPRPHKNEHLFLNDISGSCEWISSWFFMLMFSAQTAFKRSRTFEFDNKVIETTKALKEEYLIDSFVKVKDMRIKHMMVHGTSDMYSAFKQFQDKANINNKSYVIILSDCRDWAGPKVNGIPASVEIVEEMVRDAKKVIILNPEDKNKWDIVDSCVSLYREAGAQVFEVNTLNQLAHFVEQM